MKDRIKKLISEQAEARPIIFSGVLLAVGFGVAALIFV